MILRGLEVKEGNSFGGFGDEKEVR